ncbi:AAA family ATPase [Variovorax sp. CAN2819]|uniref:ATP-dependent nuclease n=1 Tax=Variovorax sp. CAN15 TaxID=3046727 RepID=UPI002647D20E|nr:AAA family ATPase [Variovorax sp. CAN15]MDN6888390.1 AAA family ATPase [Variovorax sp. CAN15]
MRLEKITISNFKSLRHQVFEPMRFCCLVGENNAGKSSVLQAVVTALNRPAQLPLSHFYDPTEPVEFIVHFTDVSERHLARLAPEHRARIGAIVVNDGLTLCVRYRPTERVEVAAYRLAPRDVRLRPEAIDAELAGLRGAAIRETVVRAYPEFIAAMPETIPTLTAAKAFLQQRVEELPREEMEMIEGPLPSGIAPSISMLLPEAIYIPAVKNLSDDLKTTQSTSFGRLLSLLLEDMTPDLEDVERSLSILNALFNRVTEGNRVVDKRHPKVQSLESRVESLLGENFPSVRVELNIPPPELKTILSTAQIYIDDGSRDLIENKGDGIKRSLTFALLQAYVLHLEEQVQAAQNEGAVSRPLFFLFEEPELYLHPKSQRVLFNTLARIASSHQVALTTHSPLFFAPGVTAAFVRVAKRAVAEAKPEGVLYPVNFDLDPTSAEVFQLARFENADAAFFSQRVILFEGESDDAYCRHVAKILNLDWDFDKRNVTLVRVSGKGNFAKFRRFFSAFGIEVKVVADLDALFEGYQHLGASADVAALRQTMLHQIDARIAVLGTVAEPKARQIKARVQQESWKAKYDIAKETLRAVQASRQVDDETLALLDGLFAWEREIARMQACEADTDAAAALVPVLDALRAEGICVLARGAIEDYYPSAAPTSGSKPERALAASNLVTNSDEAIALSRPLVAGRLSELQEIFEELFR